MNNNLAEVNGITEPGIAALLSRTETALRTAARRFDLVTSIERCDGAERYSLVLRSRGAAQCPVLVVTPYVVDDGQNPFAKLDVADAAGWCGNYVVHEEPVPRVVRSLVRSQARKLVRTVANRAVNAGRNYKTTNRLDYDIDTTSVGIFDGETCLGRFSFTEESPTRSQFVDQVVEAFMKEGRDD